MVAEALAGRARSSENKAFVPIGVESRGPRLLLGMEQQLLSHRGPPPGRNVAPWRLTHQIGRPPPEVP